GRRHPGAGEVRMSQGPGGERPATESARPAFPASSAPGLPRFEDGRGPATLGAPSERALHRSRRTMLAVIGGSVVVLAVIALILSQTVFRSVLEDPGPTAYPTADRSAEGQSEYVPDPEEPEIAPPPPIFTQAPTTECTVPGYTDPHPPPAPGRCAAATSSTPCPRTGARAGTRPRSPTSPRSVPMRATSRATGTAWSTWAVSPSPRTRAATPASRTPRSRSSSATPPPRAWSPTSASTRR